MAIPVQITSRSTAKPYVHSTINTYHDDFVMTAHDLRNPLACIISSLELLNAKVKMNGTAEADRIIDRGLRAAERIDEMLQTALESRRSSHAPAKAEYRQASLFAIFEKAVEFNQTTAERKEIALGITGDDVKIEVDARLLLEALDNLVNNAVKYSFPGSTVTCRIDIEGQTISLRVVDEGQGLTAHDLQRMGEPYQRLSATPTGGEVSTGLGLWSVKRIVKMLGGKLHVTSAGVGQGATFSISLPRLESRQQALRQF